MIEHTRRGHHPVAFVGNSSYRISMPYIHQLHTNIEGYVHEAFVAAAAAVRSPDLRKVTLAWGDKKKGDRSIEKTNVKE
ncbi:hypothetical protein M0802_004178 [Mischocyttarus mexicanus]|nr:hypothetical protein M0802_004178 [Mischocyttarus mexicanus]